MAEPVALGVQVPDSFKTIGSMLNMANSAQNLQKGNIELQQNAIKLQERKGIQDLFGNPDNFKGENGQMDYNKLINEGMKVAPTTFPTMVPQIISAHKAGVEAEKSLNELDKSKRDAVGQYVLSLGGDDPATGLKKLDALSGLSPQLKTTTEFFKKFMLLPAAQQGPEAWKNAVMQAGRMVMTPTEQKAAMTPSGPQVTNNAQSGMMNVNPMAGPTGIVPGTLINQQIPLNERQRITTNPITQSPQTETKDAFGGVVGVTQTPTGPGVPTLAPGQPQDIPIVTRERADTNAAAAQVPTQRLNNREIMKVLDTGTLPISGAGAETLSKILGSVGLSWTNNQATNTQNLAHYLALQAQNNAKAMGAGTDAAREISSVATGNTAQTPDAIKKVTKINDALSTGVQKFNEGMESAIKNSGGNVLAAREFKNEWSKSFDPDVYRFANALESNDKKEIDSILGKPGTPERAAKARALAAKSQRLNELITQGR